MRLSALPVFLCAVMSLSVAPVSAQTVSMNASITNTSGPVTSCPVTINFTATISATNWSSTANRQVQYKWIRSDGADAPTQTLNFPAGGPTTQTVTDTWQLGANGQRWEAIQISYPPLSNATSNHAVFTLTCPTPGSLQIGTIRLISPIIK
jgi:hypothetical protein